MAVKVVTETKDVEVKMLEDVDVDYVSLVRHGANKMPFRVIKSEEGGGRSAMTVAIQSIILPTGVSMTDMAGKKGLEWMSDAKDDSVKEYDIYRKFEQLPITALKESTCQLAKLGHGAWALVGELAEGQKSDGVLTLSTDAAGKLADIPEAPMDVMFGSVDSAAAVAATFGQLFERELWSMVDVVQGTLKQSSGDPKKRKTAIVGAIDAFKNFMVVGLDAVGAVEKVDVPDLKKGASKEASSQDEGGENDMFKTDEEFKEALGKVLPEMVGPIVADSVKGAVQEAMKDFKPPAPAEDDEAGKGDGDGDGDGGNSDPSLEEVGKSIKVMQDSLKTLTDTVSKLGDQPGTDAAAGDGGGADGDGGGEEAGKGDGDGDGDGDGEGKDKKSVFSGLLTKSIT